MLVRVRCTDRMRRPNTASIVIGILLLLTLVVWLYEPSAEPRAEVTAPLVSLPPPAAVPLTGPPASPPPVLDAGVFILIDAGAQSLTTTPPPGFDLDKYLERWRRALRPLMRPGPHPPVFVQRGARPPPPRKPALCEPGSLPLPFDHSPVDVFVFIDTSGSMWRSVDSVAVFLATLEARLVTERADHQLVLIAHGWQRKRPGPRRPALDAGVLDQIINSHDMLSVVTQGTWQAASRPGALSELLLITDDASNLGEFEANAQWSSFIGVNAMWTRVHTVGGFRATGALSQLEPLSREVCRPYGIADGVIYQQLAMRTGGLRVSLCDLGGSGAATLRTAIATAGVLPRCHWPTTLSPQATNVQATATGSEGTRASLLVEPNSSVCSAHSRRNVVVTSTGVQLCEATCQALPTEGFTGLELSWRCSSR